MPTLKGFVQYLQICQGKGAIITFPKLQNLASGIPGTLGFNDMS